MVVDLCACSFQRSRVTWSCTSRWIGGVLRSGTCLPSSFATPALSMPTNPTRLGLSKQAELCEPRHARTGHEAETRAGKEGGRARTSCTQMCREPVASMPKSMSSTRCSNNTRERGRMAAIWQKGIDLVSVGTADGSPFFGCPCVTRITLAPRSWLCSAAVC